MIQTRTRCGGSANTTQSAGDGYTENLPHRGLSHTESHARAFSPSNPVSRPVVGGREPHTQT